MELRENVSEAIFYAGRADAEKENAFVLGAVSAMALMGACIESRERKTATPNNFQVPDATT